MKRLLIAVAIVMIVGVGNSMAQNYAVAIDGSKPFESETTIAEGNQVTFDIYLEEAPGQAYAGGVWVDFTSSTDKISYVSAGRALTDGSEGVTGPWEPTAGTLLIEPVGIGTLMMAVGNLTGVLPDGDGDIIIGRVTLECTALGDVNIALSTIPGFPTWEPVPPYNKSTIDGNTPNPTLVIHQGGSPAPTVFPAIQTECPVLETECPTHYTWCPENLTFCPQEPFTQCPLETTSCPIDATFCPAGNPTICDITECPLDPTICPSDPTFCSTVWTECPDIPTWCPYDTTYCPVDPQTLCPIEQTICPETPTYCPPDWTHCPEWGPTWCPYFFTECPMMPTECFPLQTECYFVTTECPIEYTWCPEDLTYCPNAMVPTWCSFEPTICPYEETLCPTEFTLCPDNPTWCPDDFTFCPLEYTYCPEGVTLCPEIYTYCPDGNPTICKITQCPTDPTICPDTLTACPTEFTVCPDNPTWCPETFTECPMDWTTCPEIPTACPADQPICDSPVDTDSDGVLDPTDNCPNTPNGPISGTCTKGFLGTSCTVPGANVAECGTEGYCSMSQEDTFPPSANGCGDACECEGNFNPDVDDDVDGSDAAIFKADFGRGGYNDPCGNSTTCNGDFDCDTDVDGTDAAVFKADFGRGGYNSPCPSCSTDPWCVYP